MWRVKRLGSTLRAEPQSLCSEGILKLNRNRNRIKYCRCVGIITFLDVDAYIIQNELLVNDCGIMINNNKSKIIDNTIEKSHEDGI